MFPSLLGPTASVLEYLLDKDRERIKQAKQAAQQQMETSVLPQQPLQSKLQASASHETSLKWPLVLGAQFATAGSSDFKPFANDPEKQERYERYTKSLKDGKKGN